MPFWFLWKEFASCELWIFGCGVIFCIFHICDAGWLAEHGTQRHLNNWLEKDKTKSHEDIRIENNATKRQKFYILHQVSRDNGKTGPTGYFVVSTY